MKIIATIILLSLGFTAIPDRHKPTNNKVTQSDLVGIWVGTYTARQVPEQGELYYSFIIKPDNTLITESKGNDNRTYLHLGEWEIKDSFFTYKLQGVMNDVIQHGRLKINDCNNMSAGTWRDINNRPNLNGTFPAMRKINTTNCTDPCFANK